MSRIMCSVSNCHYWSSGNICDASEIMVTSDHTGSSQPDSVDAPQAGTISQTPVQSCMETCCKTFVDRNSPQREEDGVTMSRMRE